MYKYAEILLLLALKVDLCQKKKHLKTNILTCDVNSNKQGKIVLFTILSDLPKQSDTGRTFTKEIFVIYVLFAKKKFTQPLQNGCQLRQMHHEIKIDPIYPLYIS